MKFVKKEIEILLNDFCTSECPNFRPSVDDIYDGPSVIKDQTTCEYLYICRQVEVMVDDFCPEKCPQIEPYIDEGQMCSDGAPIGGGVWLCMNADMCRSIYKAKIKESVKECTQ